MRQITHPGPSAHSRADVMACSAELIEVSLHAGQTLTRAVTDGLAKAGFASGYLRLDGAALAPMHYVIPATASGDGHAAWYSQTFVQPVAKIRHGGAHLGHKDGKPFVHCHAIWAGAGMGHVLCDDSVISHDVTVKGWGLRGAGLVARPDPETLFTLFRPQENGSFGEGGAYLITLRPNQDIGRALLGVARDRQIMRARIEGIGSLVGTVFEKAPNLESHATELLVVKGRLHGDAICLQVGSVGFDGACQQGILRSGENAICVTAEILMIAMPAQG